MSDCWKTENGATINVYEPIEHRGERYIDVLIDGRSVTLDNGHKGGRAYFCIGPEDCVRLASRLLEFAAKHVGQSSDGVTEAIREAVDDGKCGRCGRVRCGP